MLNRLSRFRKLAVFVFVLKYFPRFKGTPRKWLSRLCSCYSYSDSLDSSESDFDEESVVVGIWVEFFYSTIGCAR